MTLIYDRAKFRKYLEQIIFNKDELTKIRSLISKMPEKKQTIDQLKAKLIESRVRILDDVADFTDFYINKKLEVFTDQFQKKKNVLNEIPNFKETLFSHIENLNLPEWIESVRDCIPSFDPLIRNNEKFLISFWSRLEKYHKDNFGMPRDNMPEKIKDLCLPSALEKKLLYLNKIRNNRVHTLKELTEEHAFEFYRTYFIFLTYRIDTTFSRNPQLNDVMIQILMDYFTAPFKNDLKLCSCIKGAVRMYFQYIRGVN